MRSYLTLMKASSVVVSLGWLSACSDAIEPSIVAPASIAASQEPRRWKDANDQTLWDNITQADTSLMVGLKQPGQARGVVRGSPVLSRVDWLDKIDRIGREDDILVLSADSSHLPVVRLKVRNIQAMRRIRNLPYVDYAEPALIRLAFASDCTNDNSPTPYPMMRAKAPHNFTDDSVAIQFDSMNVFNAWRITNGYGVTVGLVDTGIDQVTNSDLYPSYFTSFLSGNRTLTVLQWGQPVCNHGTRMGMIVAGPMNYRRGVGVAYGASMVSNYHQHDSPIIASNTDAPGQAIHGSVVNHGARVIVMAWGVGWWQDFISDEIDAHYYSAENVTFVGATGTCSSSCASPYGDTPIFPAIKAEVLAVKGLDHNGQTAPESYQWGAHTKSVAAYTHLATNGINYGQMINMDGSSAATAVVGGIATLVKAHNPGFTSGQVGERILRTSGPNCGMAYSAGDRLVNASAAVGGACVGPLQGNWSFEDLSGWTARNYGSGYGIAITHGNETDADVDWYVDVRIRFADGYQLGGSGNYTVEWAALAAGVIDRGGPSYGQSTDAGGNVSWRSTKRFGFLPAWDGAPYRTTIRARVRDNASGTVDDRVLPIIVCHSESCQASGVTRSYPTPPSITVTVVGPTYVYPGYNYDYSTSVNYGTLQEPRSYQWYIDDVPAGNDAALTAMFSAASYHWIYVDVTGYGGPTVRSSALGVQSNSGSCAPDDPGCFEYRRTGPPSSPRSGRPTRPPKRPRN
jgi:hypothetical protein